MSEIVFSRNPIHCRLLEPSTRKRVVIASIAAVNLLVIAGLCSAADDTRVAARQRAREEAVQRAGIDNALSKQSPPAVKNLSRFGSIEWTVKEMPFVETGSHAGISGMGMVVAQHMVYLFGGFIPAGDETSDAGRRTSRWSYRYDPKSDRWTRLPDMPARREYTRAVAADSAIYVMGGGVQGKPYSPSADVFRLDLNRDPLQWQTVAPLTVPRTHMAVVKVEHYLIVAGGNEYDLAERGYSSNTIRGVNDVFDLNRPMNGWKQRAPIPGRPRGWAASASLDGKLYVIGGVTFTESGKKKRSPRAKIAETLSYDPAADRWNRLADPPVAISGWAGAAFRDRYVIAIGGVSNRWNDLPFVYDTKADRWMKIDSPLPPGGLFNDPGMCIIGDTIYVAGGEGPGGSHFNYFLIGHIKMTATSE